MIARVKSISPKPEAPKTARKADLTPPAIRAAAITAHLTEHGPTSTADLAEALGYKKDTAHRFATQMCVDGHLHRKTRLHSTGRNQHVFQLGAAPDGTPALEPESARGSVARHPVVRQWPPHHARDLWACAMFAVPDAMLENRA